MRRKKPALAAHADVTVRVAPIVSAEVVRAIGEESAASTVALLRSLSERAELKRGALWWLLVGLELHPKRAAKVAARAAYWVECDRVDRAVVTLDFGARIRDDNDQVRPAPTSRSLGTADPILIAYVVVRQSRHNVIKLHRRARVKFGSKLTPHQLRVLLDGTPNTQTGNIEIALRLIGRPVKPSVVHVARNAIRRSWVGS